MLAKLHYLFLPQEKNNQKAKSLHLSSLLVFLFLVIVFQSTLTLIDRFKPGVLGFASNVAPQALLDLTNQERALNNLPPLKLNRLLSEAAQQKAATMFSYGCWSHNCNQKDPWWFFKNVGYDYSYAGENLARDFGESGNVVKAWMDSPTHRDNILNSHYDEIGFAVVNGVLNGEETTLVVQLFGSQDIAGQITSGTKDLTMKTEKTLGEKETALTGETLLVQTEPVGGLRGKRFNLSSFSLTKTFSLILISLLALVLLIDSILIYRQRIVRISGKSFIHLSFFIIILLSVLLSYPGQIM